MNRSPLSPGTVEFDADGRPRSPRYGDIYHSGAGAIGQARHVFLGGNGLPERWRQTERFTILETGFGLGVNFLATWAAFRDDPARPRRLHFASVEKHPLPRTELRRALRSSLCGELSDLADSLTGAWPVLMPGLHRIEFDAGRVVLTLGFGDAQALLANWRLQADAIYLDGFAPAANPDMWSASLMRSVSRACAPDATFATWSVAASVRAALAAANFRFERSPGYAEKREMLRGQWAPDARRPRATPIRVTEDRRAIVIGAGLAGCGAAYALARSGWRVDVLERGPAVAAATSAHSAILRPSLARDDSLATRAVRAGYLLALSTLAALRADGYDTGWHPTGVLESVNAEREIAALESVLDRLGIDADFARWVDAERDISGSGLWYPAAGWIDVPRFCRAALDRAGVETRLRCDVRALRRDPSGTLWEAVGAEGSRIDAAPVVVLANALDAPVLMRASGLGARFPDLQAVRGQLTIARRDRHIAWPVHVTCGSGYVVPLDDDHVAVGASYDPGLPQPLLTYESHAENLDRLARLVPAAAGLAKALRGVELDGFVAQRCVASDRLPLIGAWLDASASESVGPGPGALSLPRVPRLPGLECALGYASRGVVWSFLGGRMIAARLSGEPGVVERDIEDALDPARFYVRETRRGTAAPRSSDPADVARGAAG